MKDVPFAAVKMSLYEGLARMYLSLAKPVDIRHNNPEHRHEAKGSDNLTPFEASGVGLASGIITAFITNPLDCINTRIKSGDIASAKSMSFLDVGLSMVRVDGAGTLFRGLLPRSVIIGLGSTVFWSLYANIREFL